MLQPRPALGYAMVAVAATLFGINGTVSKVVLASGVNSGQLTEVRCAGALVGMTLIALTRPGSLRLRVGEVPLLAALGLGLAVVQWSYFYAIHRLPIGEALLIQFVAPLIVALWARFAFHEPVRRRLWVALVLSLSGLVLIVELWRGKVDGLGIASAGIACLADEIGDDPQIRFGVGSCGELDAGGGEARAHFATPSFASIAPARSSLRRRSPAIRTRSRPSWT